MQKIVTVSCYNNINKDEFINNDSDSMYLGVQEQKSNLNTLLFALQVRNHIKYHQHNTRSRSDQLTIVVVTASIRQRQCSI